jgi:uncharacterized protein
MADDRSFLGRGWAFPVSFDKGANNVALAAEEEDIRQSLIILLNTSLGERVMLPEYGANMENLLFESINVTTASIIINRIKRAILFHEPRVKVDEIDMRPLPEEGKIEVSVDYNIIATNNRRNLVFPFYLNEATNL